MMAPTIMIIGAGPFQVPAILEAQEMGYRVLAVDGNADALGLKLANYQYNIDLKDIEDCIQVARERKIAGVFTVAADVAVKTVAAVASALKLPGLTVESAEIATDKSRMRECFEKHGVPSPKWRKCRKLEEASAKSQEIGFPVVIKPADSAGSRGVSLVQNVGDVTAAFYGAAKHTTNSLILVEEFMPGVEISVEAFVHKGQVHILTLSDKVRTKPPYLLDLSVHFPSNQPAEIQKQARDVATRGILACGIDNATIHMEQMITPDGPKIVEFAARGAGFHVFTNMIHWVTGVNAVSELIKLSVNAKPDFTVTANRGCVLKFPQIKPGLVNSVSGLEEARRIPGVLNADIYVKPGDTIRPLTSGADRVCHIIAFGETRAEAEQIAERAENTFKIVTD